MSSFSSVILENIEAMNKLEGFSVVIVCCSSSKQAGFWQSRLEQCRGSILAPDTSIFAVEEDWKGGAGNALGTLYAFTKASKLAQEKMQIDLLKELMSGKISVGLYHTAGKGTRLAPLPGSENNNKPGVKLPSNITINGESSPITILEAVIKQTGCYAKSRMGRLSVFWGDQVFIPTVPVAYEVGFHVDILCSLGPMPSEQKWKEKGLDKYGLIAKSKHSAAQVEKVDHATAKQLLAHIGEIESVGASLGSFSVSAVMLSTLITEFAAELMAKEGKLDSDPHLWMPMTLDKPAYQQLMQQKGIQPAESSPHFDRISAMMQKFNSDASSATLGLFGPVDVGQGVYWWDYGQLKLYYHNTLLMVANTKEAEMMRLFLGVSESGKVAQSTFNNTDICGQSCVTSCALGSVSGAKGFVRDSVLSNVRCKYIEADNCILINVTAERIIAKSGSIIYNVIDTGRGSTSEPHTPGGHALFSGGNGATVRGLQVNSREVMVGVFSEDGAQTVMRSDLDTDGGTAWKAKVSGNQFSFEEVYDINSNACPLTLKRVISQSHDSTWNSF